MANKLAEVSVKVTSMDNFEKSWFTNFIPQIHVGPRSQGWCFFLKKPKTNGFFKKTQKKRVF